MEKRSGIVGTNNGLRVVVDEGGSVVTAEQAPPDAGVSREAARRAAATQRITEWKRKETERLERERKEKLRRVRGVAGSAREHVKQTLIPLGQLKPSPTAQRNLNEDRAVKLAEEWEWTKCQSLTVVPVGDDSYEIIDGQHRWWAAWLLFDKTEEMPCDILMTVTDDVAKAGHFLDVNTNRKGLTTDTIFAKMLTAHRPEALTVVRVLEDYGLKIVATRGRHAARPGEVMAGATLLRLLRQVGEPGLRVLIGTLASGWELAPGAYNSHVIVGFAYFISRYWNDPNFQLKHLVMLLQKVGNQPQAMEARAGRFVSALNGRRPAAIACALHETYNAGRPLAKRLPAFPMESEGRALGHLLVQFGRSVAQAAA